MAPMHAVPLLLSLLVGMALGLVAWGLMRGRHQGRGDALMQTPDGMLLGLLALAAFAMGVFLTYLVLTLGGN
jgi:hypothetical protein